MEGFEPHGHAGRDVAAEVFAGGAHAVDGDGRPEVEDEQFSSRSPTPGSHGCGHPVGSEGLGSGIAISQRHGGLRTEANQSADLPFDKRFCGGVGQPGGGKNGAVGLRMPLQQAQEEIALELRLCLPGDDFAAIHDGDFCKGISYVDD